jgi:acyl carrier protein
MQAMKSSATVQNKKIEVVGAASQEVSMQDVFDEITKIIAKRASVGADTLKPETRLDEIDVQSLDLVEIVFDIEDKFKIDVPFNSNTESRLEFTTVGQIADGVRSILAKSAAA